MSTPDDANSPADAFVPSGLDGDPRSGQEDELEETTASPRHASRKAWIWGWVGVGVLVAIASVFGWQAAQEPVRWNDVGFSIDSATQAQATFDVYLYKDSDAVCHLRALNEHFAEVGVADVTVLLSDGRQQRITAPIVTTDLATTAVVKYCEPAQ